MKKKIIILTLVSTLLFTLGSCGRNKKSGSGLAYDDSDYTISISQVSSETTWEGAGFNPSSPAVAEGRTPPAFRDMSNLYGRMSASPNSPQGQPTFSDMTNSPDVERKLEKRANVRIRVENLEEADAFISSLMNEYNSYPASTNIEENNYFYSLRVPSKYYDVFLSGMNSMGRLLHKQETTEDVTLRYHDLEGQLVTKKELLRTFQSYLGRANNIEEILAVETRISQLQHDIDGTGTQLRNLANRVDYATIELRLTGPATAIPTQSVTFGERIKRLFGGFGGFLSTIVMVILGIVIYGIPILLVLGLIFWLFFGRIGLARKAWGLIRK
ncbi:MAG: DUF4349 domain-containing protein [Bacteroidales bacterium]|jgi:hypothetical protein|nr:DUF4349 domain-containing protein [Bacteroidales bacterium]